MNFLVIGCGSIGERHIRNLKSLGYEVSGYDKDVFHSDKIRKKYAIETFCNLKEALKKKFSGAFICTPTRFHIPIAIKVAREGTHLFIEKPLSDNFKQIDELCEIQRKKNLVLLVGCNTRFLPSFKVAKRLIDSNKVGKVLSVRIECGFYLPYWHPKDDYRKGYSARKDLGGGVILDDIHELDSLYYLFGEVKEVFCIAKKVSSLKIDTEDLAEILLKFKSGVIAQIHLDYLQRTYRRSYEFIGEKGIIIWDYINQNVELYTDKMNQKKIFQESINTNREIMFIDEIKHFINCIKKAERPINNISDAINVLKIAFASHQSAQKKEIVYL